MFNRYKGYSDEDYLLEHFADFVIKMCKKLSRRYKKKYMYFRVLKMIEKLIKDNYEE